MYKLVLSTALLFQAPSPVAAPDAPVAPAPVAAATTNTPAIQLPAGFSTEDRFESIQDACLTLSFEIPPKEYQAEVFDWCVHRTHASTRGKRYRSRIDGSWIHDMDRPAAWPMYRWGLKIHRINPGTCVHDRLDTSRRHPKKEKTLARNWPFKSVRMDEDRMKRWMSRPYDAERYGTRGPHDNNVTVARSVLPGCWSPAALDRNDVAAFVTVMRATKICKKHKCKNNRDIVKHWGR